MRRLSPTEPVSPRPARMTAEMSTDARFLAAMFTQRSNLRRPPGPMSRAHGVGSDTLGGSLPALREPLTQRFRTPGGGCPLSRVASTGCAREVHSVYAV